jgi:putative tributyrin esterase
MAFMQVDFFSNALMRTTSFNIILPNDVSPMFADPKHYTRGMKTLFLLHGYCGNNKDWILYGNAMDIASKYNMAIVLPTGENSFYLDAKGTGKAYCRHVGEELVEYVRKTFGLSDKKEDTYIGGFSMGGFGAIHTALAYPNTFSKAIGLSSALIIHNIKGIKEEFKDTHADYDYYTSVFGDLSKLETSVNNPEYLILKLKEGGQAIPKLYIACGTEDFLIKENRAFHEFLQKEKVDVEYIESPGVHDWVFWNKYLEPSVQWALSE